jgi:hypothetical protein
MPTMDETIANVNRSRERLDRFVDAKAAMEHRQWRQQERVRADALDEARIAQLEQARKHVDSCRKHQARYDSAYRGLGTDGAPPPHDGEYPGDFRRRLMRGLQDKLPASNQWANVDPDDLDKSAIGPIEAQVLEAAEAEGKNPSPENLPRDDSMIARVRTDPMSGARMTHFYGRESFIKSLSRPGRRVVRITNPDTMQVLWGAPFSRLPGT